MGPQLFKNTWNHKNFGVNSGYRNLNMVIWHLYVFDFAHLKNFLATGGFLRAKNRKNEAVFREFFEMVNLYEIFYVMKFVGKILRKRLRAKWQIGIRWDANFPKFRSDLMKPFQ
jgi:hypothetical protein